MRRAVRVQRVEALLLGPLRLAVVLIGTVALIRDWVILSFSALPFLFVFTALAIQALVYYMGSRALPAQYPRERRDGALAIREVPEKIAREWVAMNPEVRISTAAGLSSS